MEINLDIRVLRNFIKTVEMGNITNSSKSLHISQPALSRQINDLERSLHVTLFTRGKHGVSLTPVGDIFYQRCKNMLREYDDFSSWACGLQGVITGALSIGQQHANTEIVSEYHSKFFAAYPEVSINNYRMGRRSLITDLISGELDAAYLNGHELRGRYKNIRGIQVGVLRNMLLVSRKHPLAKRKSVHLSELKNEKFILPSKETAAYLEREIVRKCASCGFVPRSAGTAHIVIDYLTEIVRHNAVALYPYLPSMEQSPKVTYVELEGYPQQYPVCLAWNESNRSAVLSAYIAFIEQQATTEYYFDRDDSFLNEEF